MKNIFWHLRQYLGDLNHTLCSVHCVGTIGVQSRKFEKSEKIDFLQMIHYYYFWTFWTLLELSRVKRMLRGRFWCLVCVNQTIHYWVMAVWLQFLRLRLLEAQNVLSISGCKTLHFFPYTDVRRTLGVEDQCVYDRMRHLSILTWATIGLNMKNVKKKGFFKGGLGTCVGKLELFKCHFSVIFAWFVMKHVIRSGQIPSLWNPDVA